ncbi:hypothetical protein [Amycolatopsis sp. NPDC051128]|uniref:hypothetical protein n=1 Tax=Amycolatopsis sp. NPDC051128 TaxID=3155412 RepID=UPI00341D8A77
MSADVQSITVRQTDRYPVVSFPAATGNGKPLAAPFPAAAFSVCRSDSAAKTHRTTACSPGGRAVRTRSASKESK